MEPMCLTAGPTGMGERLNAGSPVAGLFALATGVVAASVLASGCTSAGPGGRSGTHPGGADPAAGSVRLAAFNSCPELLQSLRTAAERNTGPYGFGLPGWGGDDLGGARRPGPPVARNGGPQASAEDAPAAPAPAGGKQAAGAGAQGQGYSGTNVHEAGVDEPDLVKTDGRR